MTKTLSDIAGIGFGRFSYEVCTSEWEDKLRKLLLERLKEFNFPILFNLPIGHGPGNACIPLGFEATLNGNNGTLSVHNPL